MRAPNLYKISSEADRPVFVIGTPRSGTTLTARILGRHSELFMPGETHYFPDVYASRKQLGDPADSAARVRIHNRMMSLYARYNEPEDQARVEHLFSDPELRHIWEESSLSYRSIFAFFMQVQAESVGKSRWGNNAPRDIFEIDHILSFFPDAKIVVCIRDPRDFLLSYKGKWRVTSDDNVERLQRLYHPVVTSLLWKSSMALLPELRRCVSQDNILIQRYEDLVSAPETAIRKLCAMVGVAYEHKMLDIKSNNSSDVVNSEGIFSSSIGRWHGKLPDHDIWIAQKLLSREMAQLGYAPEGVAIQIGSMLRILLSTPYALWRGLHANAKKRGPLIPYLVRRISLLID